jgi:release factor glutamine methyltransferase
VKAIIQENQLKNNSFGSVGLKGATQPTTTHYLSMLTIKTQLAHLLTQFHSLSSPRLDAEILLSNVLQLSRAQLHAYPERELTPEQQQQLQQWVQRRLDGESVAHILGEKEFWSLPLVVNSSTLIPRPETEQLVEQVLQLLPAASVQAVADLGTGSGAIALALAHERPHWQVVATDIDPATLQTARQNAERLGLSWVEFREGDWCAALPAKKYHVIVSNPPYLRADDPHLTTDSLRFEPSGALIAGADGLAALRVIIAQARAYLADQGWLLLEHGYDQGKAVRSLMVEAGFTDVTTLQDLAGLDRITLGHS